MAATLPALDTIAQYVSGAGLLAFVYGFLITTLVLTAVFSSKPVRRKAAKEVLLLLLPRRGRERPGKDTE